MRAKAAISVFVVLAAAMQAFGSTAESDAPVAKAKDLFERYVALEHAFDPAVADLYSDDAVITNKRTYPTGEVKERTLPAPIYKELVRQTMPLAKARSDRSTYSDVQYAVEGDGVRITATRFSNLKKYHSPLTLVAKPSPSGVWLIYAEQSESQP